MKFVSELICFIFILLAMSASSSVNAVPRTDMDELYGNSIYLPGYDGEIPSAFESGARDADQVDSLAYQSAATETVDLDLSIPENSIHGKKLTSRLSRKKSSRN